MRTISRSGSPWCVECGPRCLVLTEALVALLQDVPQNEQEESWQVNQALHLSQNDPKALVRVVSRARSDTHRGGRRTLQDAPQNEEEEARDVQTATQLSVDASRAQVSVR